MEQTAEIWSYDGSFAGWMTLVDRAFRQRQVPTEIFRPENAAPSLFPVEWIETNHELANRLYLRLKQRVTATNLQFIQDGFYSSFENKELCLLTAVEIALSTRDNLQNYIGHPDIRALQKSIKSLYSEAHSLTGFVRFEYVGEILFSKINPKHYSLLYICPHFAERYPNETMMIYDETRRLLAVIDKGKTTFVEDVDCPEIATTENEQQMQENWRTFLTAVTIKERINPRVQMGHLPLRYRGNMVDFDNSNN